MSTLRGLVLTVRFACELGMLASLAIGGAALARGPSSWLWAGAAPLIAATVWGLFVSPRARHPVPVPLRLLIELVLFGLATAALVVTHHVTAAVALGTAALVTSTLNAATASRKDRHGPGGQ